MHGDTYPRISKIDRSRSVNNSTDMSYPTEIPQRDPIAAVFENFLICCID